MIKTLHKTLCFSLQPRAAALNLHDKNQAHRTVTEDQMTRKHTLVQIIICLALCLTGLNPATAGELEREYVTTTPVLADGVLYVASSTYPGHRGHLRAIDILDTFPVTLWDAAEQVPLPGIDDRQPDTIQRDSPYRSLFTNDAGSLLPLSAAQAETLLAALRLNSLAEAKTLLHAIRGRRGGSSEHPEGVIDDAQRLWNISRSSPVMVGSSRLNPDAVDRDRVLYAGAEDGMLHAFFTSRWNSDAGSYLIDDPDGGTELWAYLPGSFLPHLKDQPLNDAFGDLAVHLDGTPVVRELFLDLDGDGRRRWQTLLVATGTRLQERSSSLFVLDVTDPYQPELLWERPLPGTGVGRTRGVNVSRCASSSSQCIYLTTDFDAEDDAGIHALAITLETGELLWQFTAPYPVTGVVASATPAVPVLIDLDDDGLKESLVFGDLVGQLWALNLTDGQAYGHAPVFVVPGGESEPIGAAVAVYDRVAVFGTGGVEGSSDRYQYALYAVEIFVDGGRLRWTYPLDPGEKVWQAPVLDATGNLLFATSVDYLSLARSGEQPTSGRVVALNSSGAEEVSRNTRAATLGRVVTAPGVVITVDLTGEVTQFGAAGRLTGPDGNIGSVKILSWRQR
jgi:outer membrane protein assembly factor BamB